jgi:hypothetical protein
VISGIIQAVRWLGAAVTALFDWLDGERLRKLGRLEGEAAQREADDEARHKAEAVDALPDITDRAELLGRLQYPRSPGPPT